MGIEDIFGLAGLCLDDKYLIEAPVARGGFGIVYRGRHLVLQRTLAIKVLAAPEGHSVEMAARFLEDFAREAQIVSRFEHPAVVKVLDFGQFMAPNGVATPWMAMDWIEGETLSRHLLPRRGAGGRSPAECFELLRPVLEALADAHALGVAHRDLKPSNLMVVDPGILKGQARPSRRGQPPVRLLDFGIAKVMSADEAVGGGNTQTQNQFIAFSPQYAAPEQFARTRTGPWTDVHAMGLILSEVLTDRSPYRDLRHEELVQAVYHPTRPTPASFGVDVGAWEPILARALSFRASERYQNANDLLEALEAALPIAPTRASTPAPPPAAVSRPPIDPAAGSTYSTLSPSLVPVAVASDTEKVAVRPKRPVRSRAVLGAGVLAVAALVASASVVLGHRRANPTTALIRPAQTTARVERVPDPPAPLVAPVAVAQTLVVDTPPAAVPEPAPRPTPGRPSTRRAPRRHREGAMASTPAASSDADYVRPE